VIETYLRKKMADRDILLMTHIVIGYPSFEASLELVDTMVGAGVEIMELQIPFSEPIADGPVILAANQKALEAGATVSQCMEFARTVTARHPIPFLFMTYYNIPFKYGVSEFVKAAAERKLAGAIVPDLPPEEGIAYLKAMADHDLSPIFIFSPTSSLERMRHIAAFARGMVYCVARKGVTGARTDFTGELDGYLARARQATDLPLALGFGVKSREDIDFLKGKADIAVVGTQTLRILEQDGMAAVGDFISGLR